MKAGRVTGTGGAATSSSQAPPGGRAEVRVVAGSPDAARKVAEVLRRCFAGTEQRSYPADEEGGARLHLTVDTTRPAEPARGWLESSEPSRNRRAHSDEL
ncbi:hypothetical protein [Streptomyces uncialis]|uniref:hypothetical protein n=1 Tax=Streptomyces uncialis TaxID=1048205 RepID=UPI0037AE5693